MRLPNHVRNAKQLKVQILLDRIHIATTKGEKLLSGMLYDKINHKEAVWSINERQLQITLGIN